RLAGGQRIRVGRAAGHQPAAQVARGAHRRRQGHRFVRHADLLTQPREVKDPDLQSSVLCAQPSNSENGRYLTTSPRRIAWPGGLSTRPSPCTVDISTAEPWFGKSDSSPLSRSTDTRRNSRRLSGRGQSKPAV